MPLKMHQATESDAPRIADIHMAAFGTNEMLLAQFPTPSVRTGLWTSLVRKVVAEMRDDKWEVLVVRDVGEEDGKGEGEVIGFAKWCRPIWDGEAYEEEEWVWPEGTDMAVLNEWTRRVEEAGEKALGKGRPCYRLSFIATHPSHERRGVASLMINWGLERSKRDNVPTALESTWNAAALYERLGFRAEETISMALDYSVGEEAKSVLYEETCFVFWPDGQGRS